MMRASGFVYAVLSLVEDPGGASSFFAMNLLARQGLSLVKRISEPVSILRVYQGASSGREFEYPSGSISGE